MTTAAIADQPTRTRRTRKAKETAVNPTPEPTPETQPETELKRCACGCNAVVNPRRQFQPGHDMKLRSALLKHWDEGQGAMAEELVDRGWYSWEELYDRRDKREAKEKARAEKAEAKAAKAKPVEPTPEPEATARPKRSRTRKARAATEQAAVTA